MSGANGGDGHAFISYARDEDARHVDILQKALEAAEISVWRDIDRLEPGDFWETEIKKAIDRKALAFIVCFSRASVDRPGGYQNKEITLAIEKLRENPTDETWIIPVRFDDCKIPDRDIGGGRTLASIQHVDLFGAETGVGTIRLVKKVLKLLGRREDGEHTASGSPPYWTAPQAPAGFPGGGSGTLPVSKHDPSRGGLDVENPPPVKPPPMEPSPPVNRVRKRRGIAAVIGAVCAVSVISLLLSPWADGPHATPKASRATLKVSKAQVPRGCTAQLGGLKNNEPIGFVNSSCFPMTLTWPKSRAISRKRTLA